MLPKSVQSAQTWSKTHITFLMFPVLVTNLCAIHILKVFVLFGSALVFTPPISQKISNKNVRA